MTEIDSGGRIEELLRDYFVTAGYYAVRGLKISYGGADVTDLDLWLYLRPSPFTRERVNVDAKFKTTPKAMERVLWAKGAQTILGLQRCIVATTDKRPVVKEFGERHNVLVLDGMFLQRLATKAKSVPVTRLADEDFLALLGEKDPESTAWKAKLAEARSRLLFGLDYGGCNLWLDDAEFFFLNSVGSRRSEAGVRLGLLMLSYFLIGMDYSTRDLAFEESTVRKAAIEAGLRFGQGGQEKITEELRLASGLIERYAPNGATLANQVRRQAIADLEALPMGPVADFLSKADIALDFFSLAREVESIAYRAGALKDVPLPKRVQAVLGVVLDLAKLDRAEFFRKYLNTNV
jgi:hypothetical protein